jgi:hypothetical protein
MRGAMAGIVATGAMSGFMGLARLAGAKSEAPPRKITRIALEKIGINPPGPLLDVYATLAHFALGAAIGAVYGVTLPKSASPSLAASSLRGLAVGLTV